VQETTAKRGEKKGFEKNRKLLAQEKQKPSSKEKSGRERAYAHIEETCDMNMSVFM